MLCKCMDAYSGKMKKHKDGSLIITNTLFVFQKVKPCEAIGCTPPEIVVFADSPSGAFAASAVKPKYREVLNMQ